jgi:hypothetical protein
VLSGSLAGGRVTDVWNAFQKDAYFTEGRANPWEAPETVKRFRLSFPMFPFRGLSPREAWLAKAGGGGDVFFPAHTQIHLSLKRRDPDADFSFFCLPHNLDVVDGAVNAGLDAAKLKNARTFTLTEAGVDTQCEIKKITVTLKEMHLQV